MNNIEFIQYLCNYFKKCDLSNTLGSSNIYQVMSLMNEVLEFLNCDCPKEDRRLLKLTVFTIAYIKNVKNIVNGKFKLDATEESILNTINSLPEVKDLPS